MTTLRMFGTFLPTKAAAAGLLFLSAASLSERALAAPVLSLSPTVSPPTTNVNVAAGGFAAGALVDIYFDTTDLCLTVAGATGTVSCVIKGAEGCTAPVPLDYGGAAQHRHRCAETLPGADRLAPVSWAQRRAQRSQPLREHAQYVQ